MTHIKFNLQKWIENNPNGTFSTLCEAISAAPKVFSGWTVDDAEKIREQNYIDRNDLSIKDSYIVAQEAASTLSGHNFISDHLTMYYDYHVDEVNERSNTDQT